jgi:hypothetical protein
MSKLQELIVDIAKSQVGVREGDVNNLGLEIEKYLKSTWMPEDVIKQGFPWCSAFITWVCKEAREQLGLTHKELDLYIGARAYDWEKHGRANENEGWRVYPEWEKPKPGDLVTYDFSHIGIVIEDRGDTIFTVEGNTNGKGTRESDSGDGVWFKDRPIELVKKFIRLPNLD